MIISAMISTLLALNFGGSRAQKASKAAANLDQVRNGSFDAPIDPADWVNGNAGASNAHYREGESIPYRLVITGLTPNSHHVVQIEWDTRHSDKNAIDYITYYDRIAEDVQPLRGLTGTFSAPNTFLIPTPGLTNGATIATSSFNALPAGDKLFTIYNGTISNMFYVSEAALTTSQTATRLQIDLDASSSTVVLAWGGHIGSRLDWGFTNGVPNSAAGISGSPYHTRLISLDGAGGNQDRSLSAAAVLPPAPCSINGPNAVCAGSSHTYQGAAADSWSWTITGNGVFDLGGGATGTTATTQNVTVIAGASGSYTLSLTVHKAGSTDTTCPLTVNITPTPTVSIDVNASCGAVTLTANTGGQTGLTYNWTGPNGFTANTQAIAPTVTGQYSVTVSTADGCTSAPAAATLCYTVTVP
jgi:hypothetical protein